MDRRHFLKRAARLGAATLCGRAASASRSLVPVIDTHIHLFDTARKQGVPWPEKTDTALYKPALPARYQSIARGLGVVGAIAIEASPNKADNNWLLRTARQSPLILGVIGDLLPDAPDFPADLERLRGNPLFRGIRYGNLWHRDLSADIDKPRFAGGLKLLAETGLVLESANPDPILIRALRRVTDLIPSLTVIVDHLPHAVAPIDAAGRDSYLSDLRALAASPNVFVKLSEIPAEINGAIPTDIHAYSAKLDQLWDLFGEDKLMYGSDWPNSDHLLPYNATFDLLRQYLQDKPQPAREKIYAYNSIRAYHWRPRLPEQRLPARSSPNTTVAYP